VVMVAGGVEDLGVEPLPDIVAAAQQTIDALLREAPAETQLILVSPFSNGEPGPLTTELNRELQAIAQDAGIPYVDATRWLANSEKLFGDDPFHPADQGQQRIATKMEQALVDLGLAEPADTTASAG
jgi:lysophospholipase L1-like esterase